MSEKILIVDDDEVLGRVLGRVLSHDGYKVFHAATAAQAIELEQEHRPQLGLLDLCLPDGDGMQLANALQAQHPGLPLILMTAYPVRLRDNHEAAERFVRILTKPLNVKDLRRAIEASLFAAAPGTMNSPVPAASASPAVALPSEVPASSFFRD